MKLTCYTNVKFSKGHLIESLSDYLSSKEHNDYLNQEVVTSREFRSNLKSFRLRCEVLKASSGSSYETSIKYINYIKLVDENNETRYYFVNDYTFMNELVVELDIELDVVNTYQLFIQRGTFKNVQMERRMKDRWVNYNSTYYRIYDKCDEGLGDVATEVEYNEDVNSDSSYLATTTLTDSDDMHVPFALTVNKVYSENGSTVMGIQHFVETQTIGEIYNPGDTPAYAFEGYRVLAYCDSADDLLYSNLEWEGIDNKTVFCNAYHIRCNNTIRRVEIYLGFYSNETFTPVTKLQFNQGKASGRGDLILNTTHATGSFHIGYEKISDSKDETLTLGQTYKESDVINEDGGWDSTRRTKPCELLAMSSVNKNDSNLQGISSIPLVPSQDELIWLPIGTFTKKVVSNTYILDLNVSSSEPRHYTKNINKQVMTRSMVNESKLYGSYVRNHQIVYDTFALPVQPEYYNGYIQSIRTTIYKPTGLSNDLAFKVNSLKEQSLNSNVMTCSRNNQITIYSNEYLNYVRNGYNYDEKAQSLNRIKTSVNFGLGILNTGISLAGKKDMGSLGTFSVLQTIGTTASTLANSIFSNIENDNALAQKRLQLINTSPTTSGSTSVDLFKTINNGDKLKYVTTRPSDIVLESIYNLFYFTGYKDNTTQATLTLAKTREYFDYYQGNAEEFRSRATGVLPQVFEWIKQELASGITIEHKYNNTWLCEGQLLENWETSI